MQLNKLLTQREAQHRIIATNLEKIQAEDLSTSNRRKLLEILTEKVETIKTLNEKVANHADVDDLVTELVESEQYLIDLELKIEPSEREVLISNKTRIRTAERILHQTLHHHRRT